MVKQFLKERLGTIILFVIVVVFVIWGTFSIKDARNNAITFTEEYEEPEGNVDFNDPGTYVSIARTDRLELFYNEAKGAVQVKDLESGYLWKEICDSEVYDMEGMNAQWLAYLQSPLSITYNDLKKRDSGARTVYSGRECKNLEHEYIENGVSVTYGFLASGIYITVEYVLDDDQLVVRIPAEKIVEKSKYAVTTVELMPFMGAATNDEGGYLFYPDGSGAVTSFEKTGERPSNVKIANYYTYTHRLVTFQNLWYTDNYNRYTASLPVFGIKNGNHALFAAFTQGGENSGVNVYPSGYVVDLNHISFEVYLRNVYNVNMYSMSTGVGTSATGGSVQRIDKQIIPGEREIRYFFLNDEDADYSGMASAYREYLIENGMLKDAIADGANMPLGLQLLMGASKEGMVFDEYISMTSYEQVQEILERLKAQGITDTELVLRNWMKANDGYEYWPPASQLGGTGGFKDLNEYLAANSGNQLYLENEVVFATENTKGLAEDRDVAYDGLNMQVSVTTYDGTIYYLLNPLAIQKRNQDFLEKLGKYDQMGVAYYDLGQYAYADFNEGAPFTKGAAVEKFKEILDDTANAGRSIASAGSNQFVYGQTDYLYGLREENYGLSITDYEVPFIQMLVSGRIPYSTEGAGNLSYDLQTQKLKWVEFGAIPFFNLSYESALNLRDTNYDGMFSSTYDDWETIMVDTYKEFQENLSCVYGEQMTEHTVLTDDLIRVKYANGVAIYINYSDTEGSADNVAVPAKSYVVVRGGGQ